MWGPTQATDSWSATPAAISLTSSKVTRSSSSMARSGSTSSPQTIVYGEDVDPDRAIELLDRVTFDEVREVAAGVADQLSVACVGPHTVEELESA